MAGVTEIGFEIKTTDEVITDIQERAVTDDYFGEEFPVTPDSYFTVHTGVLGVSISDIWLMSQGLASQFNIKTATGLSLEYLAEYKGLYRIRESASVGDLLFYGNTGTNITSFFPVANDEGSTVLTQESLQLSRNACYSTVFEVGTLSGNTLYTIAINGEEFSYTSAVSTSAEDILTGVASSINNASLTATATVEDSKLTLNYFTYTNSMRTTNSENLKLFSVGGLVEAVATESGELAFPSNSLTTLIGTNINVTSVTNPVVFTLGRAEEDDDELRSRVQEFTQSTGTATKPAIEARLANLEGVSSVLVLQNETMFEDGNGIPPKAYEAYVVGGAESSIAEEIWLSKPAAIPTHGDILQVVLDNNGDLQPVKFSRPSDLYAWIRVEYELNVEETFDESNGEDLMAEAVTAKGDSMYRGEDFVVNKFYGALYSVEGMIVNSVAIATTTDVNGSPVYQTTKIDISQTENLLFDESRVVFV